MNDSAAIPLYEFEKLLVHLKDVRQEVAIRIRLAGQLWWERFAKVSFVEGNKAVFNDEAQVKLIVVSNLADVMEFEVDNPCRNFQPHFHYKVAAFPS